MAIVVPPLKTLLHRGFFSMVMVIAATGKLAAEDVGKRVALIIGNDAYTIRPLQNAVNDARAMDKALQTAGFRTTVLENATKPSMESALGRFLSSVGPDDTALFFYAGHAIQIENENVLIPVDFETGRSAIEAKFRSQSVAQLFEYLHRSRLKRTIIIIDACRSNPVAESHSLQAGLATPQNEGRDWYIAYSTSPNRVATDNPNGKNSYFTEALADLIGQPGLTIDDVFTRVRERVETATRGAQTPWSQTSLTAKFYFIPPSNEKKETDASLSRKWFDEGQANESLGEWDEAIDRYERLVKEESAGVYRERASNRLPYVLARRDAEQMFNKRNFKSAGAKSQEAFRLDPFAFGAALDAVNAHLLAEDMEAATRMIQQIRERGSSVHFAQAEAILKEVAGVYAQAAEVRKRGVPPPPPIADLFGGSPRDLPDVSAGTRYQRGSGAVTLVQYRKMFPAPAPAAPASSPAAEGVARPQPAPPLRVKEEIESTFDSQAPHLSIQSVQGSRDIVPEDLVEVQFMGEKSNLPILVDGKPVRRQPSVPFRLPIGKYKLVVVEPGTTQNERSFEVKGGPPNFVVVE